MNVFIFHGTGGHSEENWFPWLKKELEKEDIKVFVPQFPNADKPKLSEWLDTLKDYQQYINEDTILIGHSLGGIFLLRVLERLEKPVKAAFFVASSIGIKPLLNYMGDYNFSSGFDFNWEKIRKMAKRFIVYHSDNDPYVSLKNGEELAKRLGVELTFIPNAGHFNTKSGYIKFQELLERVKSVLKSEIQLIPHDSIQ